MTNVPRSAGIPEPPAGRRDLGGPARDRELVRLFQNGNREVFEELVARHQRRILAVVGGILRQKEDTEDVAQQVFLKVYMSLHSFDMRAAFSTWVYKIAVNECWDHLRKKKVRPLVFESELNDEQAEGLDRFLGPDPAAVNPLQRAVLRDAVERLLSELGEEDRQMLVLKEVEGFSVQEIAEVFGLNVNTVKVRLFRSRGRLLESYHRRQPRKGDSPGRLERGAGT